MSKGILSNTRRGLDTLVSQLKKKKKRSHPIKKILSEIVAQSYNQICSQIFSVGTKAQVGILGLGPYLVMWICPRRSK